MSWKAASNSSTTSPVFISRAKNTNNSKCEQWPVKAANRRQIIFDSVVSPVSCPIYTAPNPQYHVPVTGNIYILCYTCKDNAPLDNHHLQPFTFRTDCLFIKESFCASVLKSSKPHDKITIHMSFPLRTCRWIFASGERREDTNNCAIFSTNINYAKFGLIKCSTLIKQFLKGLQVVRDYYICVRNHVFASCEFHAALYSVIRRYTFHCTHIVQLIPTYAAYNNVHLFEVDFLKHDLV